MISFILDILALVILVWLSIVVVSGFIGGQSDEL